MRFLRLALASFVVLAFSQITWAGQLPMEDFFRKPKFAGFQLSPDGKHVAGLAPIAERKNRMNIVVFDLADRSPRFITSVDHQDISGLMWANNERILFFMDKDGSESLGIFAVNYDGTLPRTLVQPVESQVRGGQRVIRYSQVIDVLRDDPEHVLVVSNERRAEFPDIFKMNIMSGDKLIVERNPGKVTGWFTDWQGRVRGASFTDGVEAGFLMKDYDSGEWVELERSRFDAYSYSPVMLKADGVNGYVSSNVTPDGELRDKSALYEFNFKTKEWGDLVYETSEVDCCGVQATFAQKDLIGVSYYTDKPTTVWLDEKWKNTMAGIDAALPNTINTPTSVSDDESLAIIASYSDRQPGKYFLFNFNTNQLEPLAESRPWINPQTMAIQRGITYEARDGLEINGYLTLPAGSDGKNLPMVVHPHGGPNARDGWGFNPQVQYLANLGYAVLQMNFRGSTGYGMNHLKVSFKKWGQTMQDDITDGVKWAIDQGIADPDRICIYGASYGGYATMAGLVYTPELYACGVNYVGVTDLEVLYDTMPDVWNSGREIQYEMIGNPETEKEFLQQWSPSNHAEKIRAPLFMAYGRQDPRVDIEHANVMRKALKAHDIEFEYMVKGDEGHGYRKQENQYEFQTKLAEFLNQHLSKPTSQATSSP